MLPTVDVLGRARDELLVAQTRRARPVAYPSQAADDVLGDPPVLHQLPRQLLHHTVDVVELGLVAGRRRHAHHLAGHRLAACTGATTIDAVHLCDDGNLLVVLVLVILLSVLVLYCW